MPNNPTNPPTQDPVMTGIQRLNAYYVQARQNAEEAKAKKQAEFTKNHAAEQERINKDISKKTDMTDPKSRLDRPIDLSHLIGNNKVMRASMAALQNGGQS